MRFKFRNILSLPLPCLTVLWSKCFPLLYHSHKSGERENLSSCGTPVSKAVNWLFYSLKHRMKWLFSLCESSVFLGVRVRFCARAKNNKALPTPPLTLPITFSTFWLFFPFLWKINAFLMWCEIWKRRKKVCQKLDSNPGRSCQKGKTYTHVLPFTPLELTTVNCLL